MDRVLLVVDDCDEVARGLCRCLRPFFDVVHSAPDANGAEGLLRRSNPAVTHLLCSYILRDSSRSGRELVIAWRKAHPSITCVAVLAGSESCDASPSDGVDRVFGAPLDIEGLMQFLSPAAPAPHAPPLGAAPASSTPH